MRRENLERARNLAEGGERGGDVFWVEIRAARRGERVLDKALHCVTLAASQAIVKSLELCYSIDLITISQTSDPAQKSWTGHPSQHRTLAFSHLLHPQPAIPKPGHHVEHPSATNGQATADHGHYAWRSWP